MAVCSIAVPVILAGYFTAVWLHEVIAGSLNGYAGPWYGQAERGLIVLATAAPPLLALRWRRPAALLALALAGLSGRGHPYRRWGLSPRPENVTAKIGGAMIMA